MNNQAQQPSPCPECGGARVRIGYGHGHLFLGHKTHGMVDEAPFWAACCTQCGHMTQYATQEFIAKALEATRQQYMWEQRELEKRSAREQKHQEKKGLF